MFAWFFLSALYLQLVLGYSPLQVGLAFLPANLIMGALSIGLSAKLVMRFGIKPPLATGLLLAAAGLAAVRARAGRRQLRRRRAAEHDPARLRRRHRVQPGAARRDERRRSRRRPGSPRASSTPSFMMGGALGLAVLASLAASRTDSLRADGDGPLAALIGGYHVAFLVGALFAVAGGRRRGGAPAHRGARRAARTASLPRLLEG